MTGRTSVPVDEAHSCRISRGRHAGPLPASVARCRRPGVQERERLAEQSSESMFLQYDRCKIRIDGHPSRPAARRRRHEPASARTALRRNPQGPRRGPRRDRRATARIRGGTADALRQAQLCLQGRPARTTRPLHPVDSHRPGQDHHQAPHRRAARPLPTVVRQQPTAQGPRRQTRDRLATSDRDRRPVDGQDRYPALDATPETPKNLDIALHRPGIPVHQPPRSTHAADRWSTNTPPTTPISDSQTSLQGSRTQMNLSNRVLCSAVRTKPIRARKEIRLEDGFQHCLEACLDHPIDHSGNAQLAQLTARFRYHHLAYFDRLELARPQRVPYLVQKLLYPDPGLN